jgi:hypothetical protein
MVYGQKEPLGELEHRSSSTPRRITIEDFGKTPEDATERK